MTDSTLLFTDATRVGKVASVDTSKVYIAMQNDVPVNGLNIIIKFDPTLITPIGITPVGRASLMSGSGGYSYTTGKVSFVIYDRNGNSVVSR